MPVPELPIDPADLDDVQLLGRERRREVARARGVAFDVEDRRAPGDGHGHGEPVVLLEPVLGDVGEVEGVGDLTGDANDALEGDVVVARLEIERANPVEAVDRLALLQRRSHLLRTAREDVRVQVEGLPYPHLLRHAKIAERDLARDGAVVRDREDLHAELAGAVRLREDVTVGLHAVREDDGAPQVPGGELAVGELHRAREIGGGAEAGALRALRIGGGGGGVDVVTLERGRLLRVVRDGDDARPLRERDDTNERIGRLGVEALLDLGARVLDGGVGDGLGHVDEVDGADLLRRRGAREPREPQRQ